MDSTLRRATFVATLLDGQFSLGPLRFGVDAILDLLPFGGDLAVLLLSLYLPWLAWRLRLPGEVVGRMLANVLFSFLVGLLPFLGEVAYLAVRPNLRNLELLRGAYRPVRQG